MSNPATRPHREKLIALLFCAVLFSQGPLHAQPKNIILFIGDGMGFEHVRAASVFANGRTGTLAFESFPFRAEMTVQGADGSIDSAASATAMATGQKVNSGVISVAIPGTGADLPTLLELAKAQGKSTGLVTTTYVTHATPAAFGAHEPSRGNYTNIRDDYLYGSKPNVLFGGASYITPSLAQAAGYTVLQTRSALLGLDTEAYAPGFLFSGQFDSGDMPYEATTDYEAANIPHLSEMTAAALNLLDNDTDGFFLMVEGGNIDHTAHSNLKAETIAEVVEFSSAVQEAIDWAGQRNDTLIIVCSDHETGGLITHAPNGDGIIPDMQWTSTGHTSVRVPVYAWGACAEQVSGVIDTTDIFYIATAEPYVRLTGPADAEVVGTTDVTFTVAAHSGAGLAEAALYVGSGAPTLTFSGSSDIDDAQLFAQADATVPGSGPDTPAGTLTSINVDSTNPHAHAVMKFPNLIGTGPGQLPQGTLIQSAILTLKITNAGNTLNLYRLTEDWVESEVTWNSRAAGLAWTSPGAGGTGSYTGSPIVVSSPTVGSRTIDITAFVQEWANNPTSNFGLVVLDTGSDGVDFDSSESANSPVLTVTCEPTWTEMGTQILSGNTAQITSGPITLENGAAYMWNCLVTNAGNPAKQAWAAASSTFTIDTSIPGAPGLVAPADAAANVPLAAALQVTVTDPEAQAMNVAFYGREAGPQDDFAIVVLPDTQYYSRDYPTIFDQQTQYVVDKASARNTVFVTQTGDIVQDWNVTTQWDNAVHSMSILDAAGMPYGLLPGNHDMSATFDTTYYNMYFPYTRYEGLPWYGGHYGATNDHNYELITAGGRDYIFLHIGYNPSDAVIAWADGILKANAHRMAVITAHRYIDVGGAIVADGGGIKIRDGLVLPNENVRFVICSHYSGVYTQVRTTPSGRQVYEMLANYHADGWLRMLWFDPQEGLIHVDTYSPSQLLYHTPTSTTTTNRFKLAYDVDGFQYIGSQTGVASGQTAQIAWNGRQPDTAYEWYVEVTDTAGNTTRGPLWSFTTSSPATDKATNPSPVDGASNVDATTDLAWTSGAGDFTHDVYFGTDQAAVAAADSTSPEFKGNLTATAFDPGPLAYLTTYYWRIDEIDATTGQRVAIGDVWSFQTQANPYKATNPNPLDAEVNVDLDVVLSWTPGRDAASHDVYFGTTLPQDPVTQTETTYDPGVLEGATTYYWRIDEKDALGALLATGDVWSFTTEPEPAPGVATAPNPANGSVDVPVDGTWLELAVALHWTAGDRALSHRVYLGTNQADVQNATPESLDVYKGEFASTSYTCPDQVEYFTSYYWRIDEVGLGGVTTGGVWSFRTQVDTHPPVYPYGGTPQVINVSAHQATITWMTNEPTTGQVHFYDIYQGYELKGEDTNLSTSHAVTLTDLSPNHTYLFRVASTDDAPQPGPYTEYWPAVNSYDDFTTLPNTVPVANPDAYNAVEDVDLVVDAASGLLANDTDGDGDVLTASVLSDPGYGGLTLNADGSFTYAPNANYFGLDSFTYTAGDGYGGSATATVTITVAPVNDAPVAVDDDAGTVDEDGSLVIYIADLLFNDSDVDLVPPDTLTIVEITDPAHGTLTDNGTSLTYTPAPDYFGPDSFTYTVQDSDTPPLSDTATVTITVESVNDVPVAYDQSVSTPRDTSVDIVLTAADPENQTLTYAIVDSPLHGLLDGTAPDLTYTPNLDYAGPDSFTFQAFDGADYSNVATVSITVVAVNRRPDAVDDSFSTTEGQPLLILDTQLLSNDTDPDEGDVLTVISFTLPAHGILADNGDGSVTYTPAPYYYGEDTFDYTIQDSSGLQDTATVTIHVGAVNDPPVAADDSFETVQDTPLTILDNQLLANDTDPDEGDVLAVVEFTQPAHGTLTDGDGSVTYTPNPGIVGQDSFTYTVSDIAGATATATVTVTINPAAAEDVAYAETTVAGSLLNGTDLADTRQADGVYEQIQEAAGGGKKSILEHKWRINVTGGTAVTFHVLAYHTANSEGDDFVFAWSTDDIVYTYMLTVTDTTPPAAYQSYDLPADLSGDVYIRITDLDRSAQKPILDTLFVDHMFIESTLTPPPPDTMPPSPDPMTWQVEPHATSATSIAMTATTATDPSGVEYYFACLEDPDHDSGWQASPTYEDTGLTSGNEYTYCVMARDTSPNLNETGWSDPVSAVPEDLPPATPTGLSAAPGDNLVNLDWADNTESDLAGYNVYRSETSGAGYVRLNATLVTVSSYTDNTAVNGITYYYVVTAVDNAAQESYAGDEVAATPGAAPVVCVAGITMGLTPTGKNYKADAIVTIGPAAAGAIVSGDWLYNGAPLSSASGTTDAQGQVTLSSAPLKAQSGDTFTFTVTNVALAAHNYEPGQNVETSDSITVP